MRSAVFCLLFLAFIALGVQGGYVRLVHLSIPTSTVSISFNGTAKVVDAPFKEVSEYLELTDGVYLVELTINGGETTLHFNQTVTVNGYSTFVAEGQQNPSFARYKDAFYRPDVAAGKSIIRFLDAIEGDLTFDLSLNDTKIASNLGYTKMTDYFSVSEPALNVTAGNTFGSFSTIVPITRGRAYTTFIYGTAVAPKWFATIDFDYRKPTVRVVQASPDAASLSVSVGGVAFPSLSFSSQSSYQEVPKGVQLVNVTGEKGLVFNTPDLVVLKAYTVVIYGFVNPPAGNSNGLAGEVLLDAPSDPNTATVRFGNLVPDSSTFLVEFNGKNFTTFYGYLNSTFSLDTNDTQVYSIKVYNSTNKLGKRHWRRSLNDYTTLLTTSITVSKGTLYTVLIEGSGSNIRVVADNQPAPNPDNGSSGLSSGAIAGIVIGSIFGAILLVGLIVYCYRRSKYQSIP